MDTVVQLLKQATNILQSKETKAPQKEQPPQVAPQSPQTNELVNEPTDEIDSQPTDDPVNETAPPAPPTPPVQTITTHMSNLANSNSWSSLPGNEFFLKNSICRPYKYTGTRKIIIDHVADVTQLQYVTIVNQTDDFRLLNLKLTVGGMTYKIPGCFMKDTDNTTVESKRAIVYWIPKFLSVIPDIVLLYRTNFLELEYEGNFEYFTLLSHVHYRSKKDRMKLSHRQQIRTSFPDIAMQRFTLEAGEEKELSLQLIGKCNGFFINTTPDINLDCIHRMKITFNGEVFLDMDKGEMDRYISKISYSFWYIPFDGNKYYAKYNGRNAVNMSEMNVKVTLSSERSFRGECMNIRNNVAIYRDNVMNLMY
jgi:hypothetical protein